MSDTPMLPQVSPKFINLAKRLAIQNPIICDIGSRDACEGVYLATQLCARELHLFEPNAEAAELCRKNLQSARERKIVFSELAVSDIDGIATFYPVNVSVSENKDIGFSSLYAINPRYTKRRGKIVQSKTVVKTTTLDSYFKGKELPDILWIDVEGSELRVFRGARRCLRNVKLIHVEVSLRAMHIGKPLFWEVNRYLDALGFRFLGFSEISGIKSLLYRYHLLPNLPWRLNAMYTQKT